MWDNKITITQDPAGPNMEMIVTNKQSGNSFLVEEKN